VKGRIVLMRPFFSYGPIALVVVVNTEFARVEKTNGCFGTKSSPIRRILGPLVTTGMASAVDKMLNHLVHEGLGAKIAIQCGSPASVKILVKNKIGLGILFQDMLIQEIRNKLFKVLEIPGLALTVQSYIVYYKDRPLSPPAKDFLALLHKRVHRSL